MNIQLGDIYKDSSANQNIFMITHIKYNEAFYADGKDNTTVVYVEYMTDEVIGREGRYDYKYLEAIVNNGGIVLIGRINK